MTTAAWFEVDKEGLAKLLERRGKEFVIYELVQNCWDTQAGIIDVRLEPIPGQPYANLEVWDNHPGGWKNLEDAYTLFAESEKKGDPEKRGRFNLGEKLVLALCQEARIESTTGTLVFNREGRRRLKNAIREGSSFQAKIRMTRDEYELVCVAVKRLIPPLGKMTKFNHDLLPYRTPLCTISCTLPTETADAEGILRKTARMTFIDVIEPQEGEKATIYELGIPVVETGDKYHYNVAQKVPLNSDRDNVTPAYLQELRTMVLNQMHLKLKPAEASDAWVRDAAADENASHAAVDQVMTLRFGQRRVISDLNDPEGTKLAMSQGYTVIPPQSLSGAEWANVRKYGVALAAGQVTPSPKPFTPNGTPLEILKETDWTESLRRLVAYAGDLGRLLLGREVIVQITPEKGWRFRAAYSPGQLILNVGLLGWSCFDQGPSPETDELFLHEYAHEYSSDHLSSDYHDALCRLGAKLAALALTKPEFFKAHGWKPLTS